MPTACALLLALGGCAREEPPAPTLTADAPPEGAPRLVLFVTVDQFYGGYVDRFRPLFAGGLATLLDQGAWFREAHQAHAVTTTAPGHATLATGRFPSSHGIVNNSWYERAAAEEVYCCDDAEFGRAPRRMQSPTLGDLLKERWPQAKVYAVSGKDRASILSAGHHADGAYWFDTSSGGFTTSPYYSAQPERSAGGDVPEPEWLRAFHERKLVDGLFGTTWEPLMPVEAMAEYGVQPLDFGLFPRTFPRAFGGLSVQPDRAFYSAVYGSPMADWAVIQMAKALVAGEALGDDSVPDVLALGLSALDATGHGYGPDSPEMLDTLLRVDRLLGEFFDFLDQRVGMEHVLVSLSSDHGVGRVPEVVLAEGGDAGRFGTSQRVCIQQLGVETSRAYGIGDIDWMPAFGYLDRDALLARQVDVEALATDLATGLEQCERIQEVFTRDEVLAGQTPRLELFRRSTFPGRSPDLVVDLAPNTLATSSTASHGSANRYDTWVPWILLSPRIDAQAIDQTVATVDVAPTLAALIGLGEVQSDGIDRTPLLH